MGSDLMDIEGIPNTKTATSFTPQRYVASCLSSSGHYHSMHTVSVTCTLMRMMLNFSKNVDDSHSQTRCLCHPWMVNQTIVLNAA